MSWVLRQIAPPGKSALADEATALALAQAAVTSSIQYGPYLQWSDPDARGGKGAERWTDDVAKAKKFGSFLEAMECWKAQSTVRPLRPDGRPNRPLTAFSVTPQQLE
jgi:hypothetical protein